MLYFPGFFQSSSTVHFLELKTAKHVCFDVCFVGRNFDRKRLRQFKNKSLLPQTKEEMSKFNFTKHRDRT